MKWKFIILTFFSISFLFSQDALVEWGFNEEEVNNTTHFAYYFFTSVTLNGIPIEDDDWVGAFIGDVCVGAKQWNTTSCGGGICDLALLGFDNLNPSATQNYCKSGDIPTFKIYDTSQNISYEATSSENIAWEDGIFPIINHLESCSYYDCDGICGGNTILDCENTCGGFAIIDDCGICSMGFTGHAPNITKDCNGVCNGNGIVDECGICDGSGATISCWDNSFVCNINNCPFNPDDCPYGTTYTENYVGNQNAENLEKCIPNLYLNVFSSSQQAFYSFGIVELNGNSISSEDWVASFNGDICVGARQWNTLKCNNGICDVPAMGFDSMAPSQTNGYYQSGDMPTFKIYDNSENIYYDATPSENFEWQYGQTYEIDTLIFCDLPLDCSGKCGGSMIIDECNICGGDGIEIDYCDCAGNIDLGCGCGEIGPSGCDNVCGSSLEYDECGVCGGNGPEIDYDCNGNMASTLYNSPHEYIISNIYPNPFNPILNISYQLPINSYTSIMIHNIYGKEIININNGFQSAGKHMISWDASDQASGVYLISLINGNNENLTKVQKAILIK